MISAREELKHVVENLTENEAEVALTQICGSTTADALAVALHSVLQDLAAKLRKSWEDGHRSRSLNIDDLADTLLEIADAIPAPTS